MLPASKAQCERFAFPAHRDPAKCGGGGWGCSTRPWPSLRRDLFLLGPFEDQESRLRSGLREIRRISTVSRGEHLLDTKWDPGVPRVLVGKA